MIVVILLKIYRGANTFEPKCTYYHLSKIGGGLVLPMHLLRLFQKEFDGLIRILFFECAYYGLVN